MFPTLDIWREACQAGSSCVDAAQCADRIAAAGELWGFELDADDPGMCLPYLRDGALRGDTEEDAECTPCAPGLHCVLSYEEGTGVCMRHCADQDGNPDPDMCPCGDASACEAIDEPWFAVLDGSEPATNYFCKACVPTNSMRNCAESSLFCCDEDVGVFCSPYLTASGVEAEACCMTPDTQDGPCGVGRLAAAPNGGCCYGHTCEAEACVECIVDGPGSEEECCPTSRFVSGAGIAEDRCVPCSSGAECYDSQVTVFGGDGGDQRDDFVVQPNSDREGPHYDVSGGDLEGTAFQANQIHYELAESERLYLFSAPLSSDVSNGDDYVYLPASSPGSRRVVDLDSFVGPEWSSVRVYDAGSCSLTLPWETVAALLAGAVNTELAKLIDDHAPIKSIRFEDLQVRPVFTQSPISTLTPRGPQGTRDRLKVKGRFVIDDHNWLLCGGDANVRVDATLAPSLDYGWQEVPLDSAAAAVGCRPIGTEAEPDTPYLEWDCVLPEHGISPTSHQVLYGTPYAGNDPVVRIAIPEWLSAENREDAADWLQRVECVPSVGGGEDYLRGARYECLLPEYLFDNGDGTLRPYYNTQYLNFENRAFDRELIRPATARDFSLKTSVDDFYLDNACWFPLDPGGATAAWVKRVLQRALEFKLDKALEEESEVIGLLEELLVADAADLNLTSPHAINLTMRPCTTDSDCQDPYVTYEGGGRHQCSSAGFCDQFRIEPRRLNMRPEGLEVVLAEGPLDPQHSLIEGSTLFAGLDGFCDPLRYPMAPMDESELAVAALAWRYSSDESSAPNDGGLGTEVRRLHGLLRAGLFTGGGTPRSICSTDDHGPDTSCICGESGYQCLNVAPVFGTLGANYCVAGECCTNACASPNGCVDYQTDPENCGGCGDACDPGLACVSGECCDVCPSQPWICKNTQSDPESCCGTNCVAFGGGGAMCVNGECVFP